MRNAKMRPVGMLAEEAGSWFFDHLVPYAARLVSFYPSAAGRPVAAAGAPPSHRRAIGPCRYDVLKVEQSNSFREGPLLFINTDWYAPDIRLIVAREHKRGDGSVINKYDAISILEGTTGK